MLLFKKTSGRVTSWLLDGAVQRHDEVSCCPQYVGLGSVLTWRYLVQVHTHPTVIFLNSKRKRMKPFLQQSRKYLLTFLWSVIYHTTKIKSIGGIEPSCLTQASQLLPLGLRKVSHFSESKPGLGNDKGNLRSQPLGPVEVSY